MSFRERHFIFERNNADRVSASGSEFSVNMTPPLLVPENAINTEVACTSATVWNSIPNISPTLGNNTLRIRGFIVPEATPIPVAFDTVLEFAEGIYNIDHFNDECQRLFGSFATDFGFSASEIFFEFIPNEASGKVILLPLKNYRESTHVFEFMFTDSLPGISKTLGFTVDVELPRTDYVQAAQIAAFNNVDFFLISCPELAGSGIPINGRGNGVIARVPIYNSSANSIIQYEPTEPMVMSGLHLVGRSTALLNFSLTNQTLEPLVMREDFSLIVLIRFLLPE